MELDHQALPRLLTIKEVAALLRVDRGTLDRWIHDGKFVVPVRIGGAIQRFERDEVLTFLAENKTREPMAARRRKSRPIARRKIVRR